MSELGSGMEEPGSEAHDIRNDDPIGFEDVFRNSAPQEENLTPIQKLQRYSSSANTYTREMVARSTLETLQNVSSEDEANVVIQLYSGLADDEDTSVKMELIEQFFPMCCLLSERRTCPGALTKHMLPVGLKFLVDSNSQIRKLAQSAFSSLVSQEILSQEELETFALPTLIKITEASHPDELRSESVLMVGKMARYLSKAVHDTTVLSWFCHLCEDSSASVRKGCASIFAEMGLLCSLEVLENLLLPLFSKLCRDSHFAVRQVCLDNFLVIAGVCSMELRAEALIPIYVSLLEDSAMLVQAKAYQMLGNFIFTFHDPKVSGFSVTEMGELEFVGNVACAHLTRSDTLATENSDTSSGDNRNQAHSPESMEFSSFMYWRPTLPCLDSRKLDDGFSITQTQSRSGLEGWEPCANQSHPPPSSSSFSTAPDTNNSHAQLPNDSGTPAPLSLSGSRLQALLPLLTHYILMTVNTKLSSIATDLPLNCAFTLPAVVLTLGRENWTLLQDVYQKLAESQQWKIRRTLACSIHIIGRIVGREIATTFLLGIFNTFVKDVDDVREGVLSHLYDFISLLSKADQLQYLQVYSEFLNPENSRNWRFREELGKQLLPLSSLYTLDEVIEHILPMALSLSVDKVDCVRIAAADLLAEIFRLIRAANRQDYMDIFVQDIRHLSTQPKWTRRKTCVQILNNVAQLDDTRQFGEEILPIALDMVSDVVPNIRLMLARLLSDLCRQGLLKSLSDEILTRTHAALQKLANDREVDVRDQLTLWSETTMLVSPSPITSSEHSPDAQYQTPMVEPESGASSIAHDGAGIGQTEETGGDSDVASVVSCTDVQVSTSTSEALLDQQDAMD